MQKGCPKGIDLKVFLQIFYEKRKKKELNVLTSYIFNKSGLNFLKIIY